MLRWLQRFWRRLSAAWRVFRASRGEAPISRVPVSPYAAPGQFRVLRLVNGVLIETLYQGGGAEASRQYELYNPTVPGEQIAFMDGEHCRGAKRL